MSTFFDSNGIIVGFGIFLVAMLVFFLFCGFLRKWLQGPTKGSENLRRLDGKTIVITGATAGIGKETARDLVGRGARVIVLARNQQRGEAAVEELLSVGREGEDDGESAELGRSRGSAVFMKLDLGSLASVRECAEKICETEEKIDILVNNAGVMSLPQVKTKDGFDIQFGTNHLGHFLLTELLLPKIRESERRGFHPRIVILSSMAHAQAPMNWDDLNWNGAHFDSWAAYCQSKLANVMHCKELARRLAGERISVYCVHPGIVDTDLIKNLETNLFLRFIGVFLKRMIKTPFHGAQTTLYCILEESIEKESGKYYSDCRETQPHRRGLVQEDWKRLWDISEEMFGQWLKFEDTSESKTS